jgi:hypothetical protein
MLHSKKYKKKICKKKKMERKGKDRECLSKLPFSSVYFFRKKFLYFRITALQGLENTPIFVCKLYAIITKSLKVAQFSS